ncbi:shikimate kinase [Microtetraspora malaysiensis]|uniref:shikimate kinase n=1 Tax=Microtetraspora malaysiensis TaxID=161358 RepID=UPI001FE0B28F|nr:shikimate kinase [Microtetraspora malaysiensis]
MTDIPIVVTGLMGAGKTTVARLMADALDRPLRDNDEELLERYGTTAADIATDLGAAELHAREASLLREALAGDPFVVIAAAASAVEDPASRRALGRAFVVFLDAPPAVLAERTLSGTHRPRFAPDTAEMLAEQRERRLAYFSEVADLTADSSRQAPEEIAARALARFANAKRSGRAGQSE